MKILEVVFSLRPGGAERFVVDLSNELSKTNDVTLMAIKNDTVEPERDLFYASELSKRITYKNVGIGKGYSIGKIIKIYKAIKNEEADVVHLHGNKMPHYCILAIFLLHRKTKFYQTIHSDIHYGYETLFYRFLFKTVGYQQKMGVVAISDTNYCEMIKAYPKVKGACITNGRAPILPSAAHEHVKAEMSSYKLREDSLLFLHIARCSSVKNQTMLIEAFNEFLDKGHDADLVIIGANFDSDRGQAIQKKAAKRIHFIGVRKNVGDYLLNADVFCLSSNFEGMPITLIEASLAGIPIVSTPVCGAVDIVQDKKNGILSKDHSFSSYVEALEYVYAHQKELKECSVRMKDNSPYTIEACAKKYIDFFNE